MKKEKGKRLCGSRDRKPVDWKTGLWSAIPKVYHFEGPLTVTLKLNHTNTKPNHTNPNLTLTFKTVDLGIVDFKNSRPVTEYRDEENNTNEHL